MAYGKMNGKCAPKGGKFSGKDGKGMKNNPARKVWSPKDGHLSKSKDRYTK